MKALLTIAILISAAATRAGGPAGDTEPKRPLDCKAFTQRVEKREYGKAGAMLAERDCEVCTSPEFILAKAELKAASFEFAEAEGLLEALANAHPEDPHIQRTWQHMIRLLEMSRQFSPVDLRPKRTGFDGDNFMMAWMSDTGPQLLTDAWTDARYFPIRAEGKRVMRFETDGRENAEFLNQLSRRLENRGYDETGPGVFLPDSTLILTVLKRIPYAPADRAERLVLAEFSREGKFRGELRFGDNRANTAYPVFREADSTLIFSCDRPGGFGGMDLWKSKYDGRRWSAPENLGSSVNSTGDEILPTLSGDTLFFSSDKPYSGFGGMDIYAHRFSTGMTENLGLPVNSHADEHSLYVTGEGEGMLISNRTGTSEQSMIYNAVWTVPEDFFEVLTGKLADAGDQAGREVHLIDEEGHILQKTVVDKNGTFLFKHVRGEDKYSVAMPDAELPEGSRLRLFGADDQLITDVKAEGADFNFVLLSVIDYTLEKLSETDESVLAVDILGMYKAGEEKMKGTKIKLTDSEGNAIAETYTGEEGRFTFKSVSPDERYTIKAEDPGRSSTVHILNEKSEIMATIDASEQGEHVYVRLSPEDNVITLTDEYDKKVRISDKDLFALGVVNYAYNSAEIGAEGTAVLAKLANILKNNPDLRIELEGHTDSRGPDAFNLRLSQERIESAKDYLEKLGVERERLFGKGYGEMMLLNHCENGVTCTEEEHAVNRRTSFRLLQR